MRSADSRGLRNAQRVRGRRSRDDGLLPSESRQLPTGAHPSQLGHHSVDHARRPTARVVLTHCVEDGRRLEVPDASDTGAHRHVVGSQRSDFRGSITHSYFIHILRHNHNNTQHS